MQLKTYRMTNVLCLRRCDSAGCSREAQNIVVKVFLAVNLVDHFPKATRSDRSIFERADT